MQGKGIIKFFTIAFAVVCIFQLLFSVVANRTENQAREATGGDAEKYRNYIDSIQDEKVFDIFITDYTYKEVKEKQLNLGLDLQGGMNVVLEVAVVDVLRALSGNSKDPNFNKAINIALERQKDSQEPFIDLYLTAYKEVVPEPNSLSKPFSIRANQDKFAYNQDDEETITILRAEVEDAIDRSYNILRSRIDKFGVAQPNIQRQQGTGRIIIELPGVDNPERVRRLLQSSAELGFWETYDNAEIIQNIIDADKLLGEKNIAKAKLDSAGNETEESLIDTTESLLTNATDSLGNPLDTANAELRNPLLSKMSLAIQGPEGQQTASEGPIVGFAFPRDTAEINDIIKSADFKSMMPRDLKLLWTFKPAENAEKTIFQLIAIKKSRNSDKAPIGGEVITDARQSVDQYGKIGASMNMNSQGAKKWRKMTADNVGKSIAIVLDNAVYSFPNVNQEIAGGRSEITGNFSQEEAKDLANILKAGKLPAPARIIEEAVVGPSLGQEAINAGLISIVSGLILVLIFMIFYYRKAGLVANIALLANVFFIFGILAALNAVLTLPGIAGIVLTIGMSVDANVLIYERIREELGLGKSMRNAIADGYRNAYSSIIDANVTTLLTGIILFTFGTGPIQGFATTLIIGICTSLFCAIFLTRLVFDRWLVKDKSITFSTEKTSSIFGNLNISFTGKRKVMYLVSAIVLTAGIFSMFTQKFSLGVDFKGGRSYVVELPNEHNSGELRTSINESKSENNPERFSAVPEIKTYGSGNKQFKITTSELINDKTEQADALVEQKLFNGLSSFLPEGTSFEKFRNTNILSIQKVGPTIVDDIKSSAMRAVFIALLVMAAYILLRFRKWQYSLGAAIALIHDVLFILGIFSLGYAIAPFSMDIDQNFIAAILAIIGYSINDTVVVYDRLREYLNQKKNKGKPVEEVINDAVNGTLSRTIITAVTTILVVLILFLFGGETIKGFSFALLIGMFVGTYSSIFIASSTVLDFQARKAKVE